MAAPVLQGETIIVGGSLGGLTAALALAANGRASTVLERTHSRMQRGVAIMATGPALRRVLGDTAMSHVVDVLGEAASSQYTHPHAWWDVYSGLRAATDAEPLVSLRENTHVVAVGQDPDKVWAIAEDGRRWEGELLLGADGYRSIVRGSVDPLRPEADYAGYVVWLGQAPLPRTVRVPDSGPQFLKEGSDMLAVYPLIDKGGQLQRFGFGWFDATNNALIERIGAVHGSVVTRTPRVTDVPDDVYEALVLRARQWDRPWRGGVVAALLAREVVATPITEYLPERVVNGRLALLGDAAHVQSPMTGAGFEEAVTDATVLVAALRDNGAVVDALLQYELVRLPRMRRRVRGGQSFSRSFTDRAD